MKFIDEFFKRLTLPSPAFFVKLKKFGLLLLGIGGILTMTDVNLPVNLGVSVPAIFSKIGGYLMLTGLLINRMSALTVDDTTKL